MPEGYIGRRLSARYPTDLRAWRALKKHQRHELGKRTLAELFKKDYRRAERFTLEAGDLLLDYSKNHITAETRKLFVRLAKEAKVPDAIEAMFAGRRINETEERPVLHVALRSKISDTVALDTPGVREVWEVLAWMDEFIEGVHDGKIRGATGKKLTQIVNIGIGGSDLGPVMASRALKPYWKNGMRFHSVSNVDGTQLADLKRELDPAETLFVVCSKTFTTLETMTNAKVARAWIVKELGKDAVPDHFVAASTNHEAMDKFGIHPDYRFAFWDWVGGRYSIWSAVGLSVALVTGMDVFQRVLSGGRVIDQHFQQAALEDNLPVILAMLGIWYNNFFGAETQAILPYDNRLERFPAYLQQLQMESSGKRVRMDGKPVKCDTGQVIWGEAGNNAQHSFYQLLHQGTRLIPVDFILPVASSGGEQAQQDLAIANCLAQSEALMDGFREEGVESYRAHTGNNPSNTILMEALTPETLGQLIAAYEHKVFVEGVIWGIDSFDQWGVELGKKVAKTLTDVVTGKKDYEGDNPSTKALVRRVRKLHP